VRPDPQLGPEAAPAGNPDVSFLDRLRGRDAKKGRPDGPPGPWVILAAWGPCGYVPVAPGTAGTLGAIPLWWALRGLSLPLYGLTLVAFIALASWASHLAGRYWKVADASPIVIDEVAGYLVTMALVPWSWQAALVGFVLFRLYDVVKPWPASAFDRMKNGFGVVMDDVVAGVFAWATLALFELVLQLGPGCASGPHWYCVPPLP
jgi:phosphatidylglycerophosphatase A